MTAFEDFVNLELPRRSALLTVAITGFDGDPNVAPPPIISGAPVGTEYLNSAGEFWRSTPVGVYVMPSGGGGGVAKAVTEGDFTITMDTGGTDPAAPIVVTNQAEVDAHGAFLTVEAAMDSLPDSIRHIVTFQFPDGDWLLSNNVLGNMTRFNFLQNAEIIATPPGLLGSIVFRSANGIIAEPAQPTIPVNVVIGEIIHMISDPGFTADQFKGYHLEIISGAGAGQIKPIRTHAAKQFQIAGTFNPAPDNTSTARISRPAAALKLSQDFPVVHTDYMDLNSGGVKFLAIDIKPTAALSQITFKGGTYLLGEGTRILDMLVTIIQANLLHDTCVIRGLSVGFPVPGITIQAGLFRTNTGNAKPILMIGDGAANNDYALKLGGSGGGQGGHGMGSNAFIFGGSVFDGWGVAIIQALSQFSVVTLEASGGEIPRATRIAPSAIDAVEGARISVDSAAGFFGSSFRGSVGQNDIKIDGDFLTWDVLDADPDKIAVGKHKSVVQEKP